MLSVEFQEDVRQGMRSEIQKQYLTWNWLFLGNLFVSLSSYSDLRQKMENWSMQMCFVCIRPEWPLSEIQFNRDL